jgi:hypothetical protein
MSLIPSKEKFGASFIPVIKLFQEIPPFSAMAGFPYK